MTDTEATPPYLQVADALRTRIATGALEAGARLPSLTELSDEFGYSGTVGQRAYALLVDEGLVISRPGAGHYVRSQAAPTVMFRRQRVRAGQGSPVAQLLAEQGVVGSWQHESGTDRASEAVAARLEIPVGDGVMHTRYTYLANGEPVQIAESWEPLDITGGSLIVLPEAGPYAGIGVADRMAVVGVDVGVPVEQVRARTATRAEAQQLGCAPAAPVMAIMRTYYDQANGRPVETADIVLLGSRWVSEYGHRPQL
ncbi:GntR family transcriptional regulator [Streptacidiphilus carbonis]|uniref:GntR family transcriptional regulator n=1 Tax=Streptacidiphilus carbonis TaxID=105422 RepID=UPI0005A7D36C|nr:GntR family transcriptional regulator [Streptacidiphilus carbonis]